MKKYFFFLLLILFLFSCGNGPAEDRGRVNCQNLKIQILLAIDFNKNNPIDPNSPLAKAPNTSDTPLTLLALYPYTCSNSQRDSLLDRYYRGYVLGKE